MHLELTRLLRASLAAAALIAAASCTSARNGAAVGASTTPSTTPAATSPRFVLPPPEASTTLPLAGAPARSTIAAVGTDGPSTDAPRTSTAVAATTAASTAATTATPSGPATGPSATTRPAPATTRVQPAAGPAGSCAQTNGMMTTPSGRHVLLRAGDLSGPSPVIVVIHGYTGTPTGIETYAQLTSAANAAGIAVAYPEGSPTTSGGGFGWSTGAGIFATAGTDDIAALAEMIATITATGCIDPARMVLTGESNGGAMALEAACSAELAGRFREVVLVNPAVDDTVVGRCATAPVPTPLTVVAGLLDRTVPYAGGRPPLLAQREWFARAAAQLNQCASVDAGQALDAHVVRTAGTGCAACTELLTIDDGTHTWPGTSRGVAGLVPGSFDLDAPLLARTASATPGCITTG
ncbi:MAG: polyhydroxybutyrate depolymerase [Ilumatobacteraceae bacterium]|nr:polyhydroxybutyrate depolymerase [Ilumatobacteraceae bacterium]